MALDTPLCLFVSRVISNFQNENPIIVSTALSKQASQSIIGKKKAKANAK
jgi:hypothetical protein